MLPGKAGGYGNSGVPGQGLIYLVAQQVKQVQSKAAMLDEPVVRDDVLQVAHQAELKENHRIDRLLTTPPIVFPGKIVKKIQVQPLFELAVNVVLWHVCR
jgi:hypothetical protein